MRIFAGIGIVLLVAFVLVGCWLIFQLAPPT